MKKPNRTTLLSDFCYAIGGFNASESNWGRFAGHVKDVNNDREVVDYLLKEHKESVTRKLKQEIIELKAKLFDLQNK